jgi:hypothetical protein
MCPCDMDRDNSAFTFEGGYMCQLFVKAVTIPNIRILKMHRKYSGNENAL